MDIDIAPGLVLALLTVNISASSVTAIYWLLLYAVVALPGAAAAVLLISAVQLA
jgi:hypothetical protein